MSVQSTIDQKCDPVASASVPETEPAGGDEGSNGTKEITMRFTKKYVETYRSLQALERVSKKDYTPAQLDTIVCLEETMDEYFYESQSTDDFRSDDIVILAECFLKLFYIKVPEDETEYEQLYISEFYLMQNMTLLKNIDLDSRTILVTMVTLDQLSNVSIKLGNPDKSLEYSNLAFQSYMRYTKGQDDFFAPISILTVVDPKRELNTVVVLDILFADSLRSLMTLKDKVRSGLVDSENVAVYMHKLLKKQLKYLPQTTNYIAWTTEVLRLADYLLSCDRFVESKSHLAVATVVMSKYLDHKFAKKSAMSSDSGEFFQHSSTIFIARAYWVKYGLALLFSSRKRLLNCKEGEKSSEVNSCKLLFTAEYVSQCMESLPFECTEKEYEEFVYISRDSYIANLGDAKIIFVHILQLLNKIRNNKFIAKDAEVRAEIAQYVSKAYKYFALYEHDKMNRIKLHKRRIETLEECLKTLNKEDDKVVFGIIWFELAIIYSTVIDIKIKDLNKNEPSAKELEEMDQLANSNRTYLELYCLNSKAVRYGLANGLIDESYQVISTLNLKYYLRMSL